LWRTLQLATSQDLSQRQSAGQQLSSWEVHEDYYPALQMVFLERTLPHDIRLLAIIQLKNGIDKYWRHHTLKNAIQPTKKEQIRSKLFSGTVGEPDKQLALHNALVTAKIIRIDYPQAWPEALPNLISLLRETKDGNQADLAGALLVLLRTVKELGSARLRKSQTALQTCLRSGGDILKTSAVWMAAVETGRIQEEEASMAIHNSLIAFKALRRLLIVGYEYPHRDETVKAAWELSREQFMKLMGSAALGNDLPQPIMDIIGKHLMQFSKLHVDMANDHPASFASLPNSFDLVQSYWRLVTEFAKVFNTSEGLRHGSNSTTGAGHKSKVEGPLLERLALKGLLLIRSCVQMVHSPQHTFKYRSQETKEEQAALILSVKQGLLTDALVVEIASLIISHLLIFRKADMEAWEEDPEEWEQQEEAQGAAWEWEVRPCAEQLLQQLLTYYKQLLMEPLLAYFASLQNPQLENVVKEAVYNTIGLAAAHVEKHFSFDELLRSTIPADAQQTGEHCKILRRRIGILISKWVPVRVAPESRPLIYQIYSHLLQQDQYNDVVVRITAARQFKWVADDFGFNGEDFHPYAKHILEQLIQLLGEVDVDETKLAILNTTKVIIERMETHITGFADMIMSALPSIWASAGDLGFMMKQSVLTILQSLVMSMKNESRRFHNIIIPLIAEAVQEGSDVYVYLIEEALELWTNVLLQSEPPLPQELLGLIPHAVRHLENHTENHASHLAIAGSYIVLAPEAVLDNLHRQTLLKGLAATYTATNREQCAMATKYTETMIRCANELGGTDGLKLICQDLVETGFLKFMLEGIHDAHEARQTSGPKRRQPRVSNLALTDYFCVLSRIALADPAIFAELVASLGPLEQVWPWLGAEWFYAFDCMADTLRQKLNLLALTRLVELGQPMQELLLGQLQDFFAMWTGVFAQVIDEENPRIDATVMTAPVEGTEWDTPKDVRERALLASDPVRNVNCIDFVKSSLESLVQRSGPSFQENYLINVPGIRYGAPLRREKKTAQVLVRPPAGAMHGVEVPQAAGGLCLPEEGPRDVQDIVPGKAALAALDAWVLGEHELRDDPAATEPGVRAEVLLYDAAKKPKTAVFVVFVVVVVFVNLLALRGVPQSQSLLLSLHCGVEEQRYSRAQGAQVDDGAARVAVDVTHEVDLPAPLRDVGLVDADGVNPDGHDLGRVADVLERGAQVRRDAQLERTARQYDVVCCGRRRREVVAPCVGQRRVAVHEIRLAGAQRRHDERAHQRDGPHGARVELQEPDGVGLQEVRVDRVIMVKMMIGVKRCLHDDAGGDASSLTQVRMDGLRDRWWDSVK
ncbi:hypothetical protein PG984_011011, partial [Apiospora sp. TS-2023a]